jgi:methylthioribose-1-phosphate isomerase
VGAYPEAIRWEGGAGGELVLIDQRALPVKLVHIRPQDVEEVEHAIKTLAVRGAPAIGIAAAYGLVIAAGNSASTDGAGALADVEKAAELLAASRPTAVNLAWAVGRMLRIARAVDASCRGELAEILLAGARAIHDEDRAMCESIGKHGAGLMPQEGGVLTQCNAGALATGGTGTALAAIYEAHQQGKRIRVYVPETRPLLQGARLTAWELAQAGVPATLITDNTAAKVMAEGRVHAVITGADRIAANGDAANKIGTYGLALLAKAHDIPFYIAAPASTFDLSIQSGAEIPIEERAAEEVASFAGTRTAPEGANVYNPAFDVTPAHLITAIITDRGLIRNPTVDKVRLKVKS